MTMAFVSFSHKLYCSEKSNTLQSCNFLDRCSICSKAHTNYVCNLILQLHLKLQILHTNHFKELKDRILTETAKGATSTIFLTLTAFCF